MKSTFFLLPPVNLGSMKSSFLLNKEKKKSKRSPLKRTKLFRVLMHKSPRSCHLRLPRPRLLFPAMTTVSRKISAASARAHTRKAKQPSHFRLPPGPCSPPSHVSLLFVFFIHLIYVFGLEWLVWIGLCCGFCITVVFFWFVICLFQNGNWGLWVSMV